MVELVINISNIISPLCYSVLRLEPYTVCPFRCIYCYSRWYIKNPTQYPYPRFKVLGMFKEVARKIHRKGLKPIPFRLSTLVDPFPPVEQLYKISSKILSIAIDYEYPLIINTKSTYLLYRDLWDKLTKLLDNMLAVLQISISTLNQVKADVLEPRAPPPSDRLRILRDVGSTGVPLILRLSPFIPFVSPTTAEEIEGFSAMCRELGVKHVIVESIRVEQEVFKTFIASLGVQDSGVEVEGYSLREVKGLKPLVRVSHKIRESIYKVYHEKLSRKGIAFTTCKEGLFDLHTAPDCCGLYLLKNSVARYTLYDLYRFAKEFSSKIVLPVNYEFIKNLCTKFSRLSMEDLPSYPRVISKGLKYHEKKLLKVLHNVGLLKHVAPSMVGFIEFTNTN